MTIAALQELFWSLAVLLPLLYLLGLGAAVHAIMTGRTSQGTVAWVIALIELPLFTLPLYLIFGSNRFWGYVKARRVGTTALQQVVEELRKNTEGLSLVCEPVDPLQRILSKLTLIPVTQGNRARLLVNGEATFAAIFDAIDHASDYVLVQSFIIRDDALGLALQRRLIDKAQQGLRVYLLYDEIGCFSLPRRYLAALTDAGVVVSGFKTTRGWAHPLRINFRNHRKIIICDGKIAFVGGHNVGDEYLGNSRRFKGWRDTHLVVEGPTVQAVQLAFLEDWFWATDAVPPLNWHPQPANEGKGIKVLTIPSGPADTLETCAHLFISAINAAERRLWIVSPYFVPDVQVMTALQLAALRGVDVRIMLPQRTDQLLVYLSSFSYLEQAELAGVKVYRYQAGFLHQKVMLVDDEVATVGTANLDNRSFRINFEITLMVIDRGFAAEVKAMLEADFLACRQASAADFLDRSFPSRLAIRAARLLAPLQ